MMRLPRLLLMVVVAALGACSIQPWVKPYERDQLADPIMAVDRNPVASRYMNHVRDAREAARGGEGGGGGGCGCN